MSREHGKAGRSAQQVHEDLVRRSVPRWALAAGAVVFAIAAADLTRRLGGNALYGGVGTFAGLVALYILRLWSGAFATTIALVIGTLAPVSAAGPGSSDVFFTALGVLLAATGVFRQRRPVWRGVWGTAMVIVLAAVLLRVAAGPGAARHFTSIVVLAAGVFYIAVRYQRWGLSRLRLALVRARGSAEDLVKSAEDLLKRPESKLEETSWARGAEGERRTAVLLRDLGRDWDIFHDVALPGTTANVDHVAIGPTGVWVIDSKAWSAPVTVGADGVPRQRGRDLTPTLATSMWEALSVAGQLNAPAVPVVCVHDAILPGSITEVLLSGDHPTGPIRIVGPGALVATLTAGPEMEARQLREVRALARHILRMKGDTMPVTGVRIRYNADYSQVITIDP
ncbi:hypothetical protein FHR83_008670 [Actinoplanes campanulatus]|uniref:NERD domain-containing protein n=1 Tax=Actinoplanes campanulatus TaxID=113559 RepID=A0A7W5FJL9_9ACTN|nr:nuclease-related domain-containing protein [Actinoplanes campanulatus]MBB3100943.1 hypothetical protein [Actinoplanes campanulatus]GGN48869.1 hypothetical protein GCM10010109_86340 [Actinoplanes campanulatus]GID41760.1 hypothetical protein Aca09nite_82660 [Actinoplanes campanulatus]